MNIVLPSGSHRKLPSLLNNNCQKIEVLLIIQRVRELFRVINAEYFTVVYCLTTQKADKLPN